MQVVYGFPREMPSDIDFYVLSNEDIGLTATLATGTNEVHSFALPYPSSIDLFDETIVVHAIEFIMQDSHQLFNSLRNDHLIAFLSMLDMEFAATFRGVATDAEDENLKAQFARNIAFGRGLQSITATASVEGAQRRADTMIDAVYYPPIPLDLVTPLYIQLVNNTTTSTLATNAAAAEDFSVVELVQLVVWFTVRKLTSAEKAARNMQIRFQRLDS